MAKKTTKRTTSRRTSTTKSKQTAVTEVKSYRDLMRGFNNFVFKNIHDRYSTTFSKATKEQLVSYGPWLATALLLVIAPELLVLANDAMFVTPVGFLERVLFRRDSWVLLIIVFINCLLLVNGLSEIFRKSKKGWNQIYLALLINIGYVLYQLFTHLDRPAAPILAVLGFGFCLFALLDIRKFYK